jgi:hypothetical protein
MMARSFAPRCDGRHEKAVSDRGLRLLSAGSSPTCVCLDRPIKRGQSSARPLAPLPGSRLKGDGRSRALVELTPSPRGSFLMRGHLRRRVSRGVGRVAELSFLYPGT